MKQITEIPKLNPRLADSHKGMFGKILIIGGSIGFSGAPALAAMAALRSGAGLVRVAVPTEILPTVASLDPCYTTIPLFQDEKGQMSSKAIQVLGLHLPDNDVAAFGPGAGTGKGVQKTLNWLIQQPGLKLVIDADGLNALALSGDWAELVQANLILTPHPGEMKRLWNGLFEKEMPQDRLKQAVELAKRTGSMIILKGAGTIVTNGNLYYVNETGNPGMSTAGSGDVLTGMIAALAGQGMDLFEASIATVHIHGLAGDFAAEQKGQISLIATDIISKLPKAFQV